MNIPLQLDRPAAAPAEPGPHVLRPPARAGDAVLRRDVGALQLLRHKAAHGAVPAPSGAENARVSPYWLVAVYLLNTVAELCISPVGLSMVSKLAPERVAGQVMGIWFLANALANFLAGQAVVLTVHFAQQEIYAAVAAVSLTAGLTLALLVRPVRALLGEVQ